MADPFVAEIRIMGSNFAPKGWALCNGQLLPISQNTALFSLIGTYYGGDGKSTFALPNLQGKAPMHWGQGPGLSERFLGEDQGVEAVSLLTSEIPAHNHTMRGNPNVIGNFNLPGGNVFAESGNPRASVYSTSAPSIKGGELSVMGSDYPHNNMQPYLVMNFVIAMQGIFPARG